jgi:hypothetical protein
MKLSKRANLSADSIYNSFNLGAYALRVDKLHLVLFKIMEDMEKEFRGASNMFYPVLETLNSLVRSIRGYKKASDEPTAEFSSLIAKAMELAPHMYELEVISEEDLNALQTIYDKV